MNISKDYVRGIQKKIFRAVSYTHLDVYKRQHLESATVFKVTSKNGAAWTFKNNVRGLSWENLTGN